MIGNFLTSAIADKLKEVFPSVYVGEPQDNEKITSPSILLQMHTEVLVGSPCGRGKLVVTVTSQVDDTTKEEHKVFSSQVDELMRHIEITSQIVSLLGIVATADTQGFAERHWQTILEYTVGFSPK